jgi:hypothetical protein
MPSLYLLDLYKKEDGRYENSFQEAWICNKAYTWDAAGVALYGKDASVLGKVMKVGDTALLVSRDSLPNKSIRPYVSFDRSDIYNEATTDTVIPTWSTNFVTLKKFVDPNRTSADQRQGYNDMFPIRLAEMYMIAAEAEFKLGNPGNAATNINVLRTRAAKSGQTAAMQVSASDITLQFILEERAREFCGEWQRWFDLKRTLKGNNGADFANYIKTRNPDIQAIQPYHNLRPIPAIELTSLLNADEFGQNRGY